MTHSSPAVVLRRLSAQRSRWQVCRGCIGVRICSTSIRRGSTSASRSAYGAPAARDAFRTPFHSRGPTGASNHGSTIVVGHGWPTACRRASTSPTAAVSSPVSGSARSTQANTRTCSPPTRATKLPRTVRCGSGAGTPAAQHAWWYDVLFSASSASDSSSSCFTAYDPRSVSSRRISPSSPRATVPLNDVAAPRPKASLTCWASMPPPCPRRRGLDRLERRWSRSVVGVADGVGVPLLGQEALAVGGEVGVDGVAADDRVEVRGLALGLRAEQSAEPLRLLLAGAERARHLDRHLGGREVDGEVGDLGHHEQVDLARAESVEEPLSLLDRGRSGDRRGVEGGGDLVELV